MCIKKLCVSIAAVGIASAVILLVPMPASAVIPSVNSTFADATANATTTYTVNFTTTVPLDYPPANPADHIIIVFPAGFNATAAAVDAATTTPSASLPNKVSANASHVTVNVTKAEAAGHFSIVLTGIINHQTTGAAYQVSVETQTAAAVNIEGPDNSAAFAITSAAPSRLKVTGNATMMGGTNNQLTITAYDAFNNVLSSGTNIYTDDKNLTFTGPSPGSVTDKDGAAVPLGTATTITFASGVSTAGGRFHASLLAEVTTVDANDIGTIDSTGNPAWDLDLTITEAPPPPAGPGTASPDPWVPPAPTPTIETYLLFGQESDFSITSEGEIIDAIQATSEDGMLTMTIPKGTIALDKNGNPLSTLTADVSVSPPPPPEEANIIGLAYDLGPDGATFDPPITLQFEYDPSDVPEGINEKDLVLAYYNTETGQWVELDCVVDTKTHTITANKLSHFTIFALIVPPAPEPEPAPAAFSVTDLSIQPTEVQPKEAVTITVSVANTGGTEDSYSVVLMINGVKEVEKSVTVAAGSSQDVSFSVTKEEAGSYSVVVDGLSGSFTVAAPAPAPAPAPPTPEVSAPLNWPLIGGSIAGVIVVIVLITLLVRRRAH